MELFLRSLAPPAARTVQETTIDRLERLEAQGHIREYELTIWGDRIRLDMTPRTPTEKALREKIDRFRRWERRNGVSLAPGFDEQEVDPLVDDAYTVFQTPMIALAVYAGSNVWGVFPCEVDGDPVTVDACLDAFLRRGSPVESRSPLVTRRSGPLPPYRRTWGTRRRAAGKPGRDASGGGPADDE